MATRLNAIDEYIATFPEHTQKLLQQVRDTIKQAAPEAEEVISYKMPAYKLHGILVYFAGYQNHIGFYAAPTGHDTFKKELSAYKSGKGSVQFPLDAPLPLALITKIVKFRLEENLQKATLKKPKQTLKTCSKGHQFYKSSECPTCPECEAARKPEHGFLAALSAPARRALEHAGITTLPQLAKVTEKEVLKLHGMGKASLPTLRAALEKEGLAFKSEV